MKKVLKQQAIELEHYVKSKHTQQECIGFIDGFERANELFALYSVSQQRELLNRFLDWQDQDNGMKNDKEWNKQYLDRYFKSIL